DRTVTGVQTCALPISPSQCRVPTPHELAQNPQDPRGPGGLSQLPEQGQALTEETETVPGVAEVGVEKAESGEQPGSSGQGERFRSEERRVGNGRGARR